MWADLWHRMLKTIPPYAEKFLTRLRKREDRLSVPKNSGPAFARKPKE